MRRMTVWIPALAILLVSATSCATGGGGEGGDRDVLTQEELATISVSNAYEAVERLRPRWLQIRTTRSLAGGPTEIVVYMNRGYLGGPEVLRQFTTNTIERMRYLDAAQATATLLGLGSRRVEGAIIIEPFGN